MIVQLSFWSGRAKVSQTENHVVILVIFCVMTQKNFSIHSNLDPLDHKTVRLELEKGGGVFVKCSNRAEGQSLTCTCIIIFEL